MSDTEVSPVVGFVGAEPTYPDSTPASQDAPVTVTPQHSPEESVEVAVDVAETVVEAVVEDVVEGVTEAVADPAPSAEPDEVIITPEIVKPIKRVAKK